MGNKIEILKFVKDSLYELKKKNFDTRLINLDVLLNQKEEVFKTILESREKSLALIVLYSSSKFTQAKKDYQAQVLDMIKDEKVKAGNALFASLMERKVAKKENKLDFVKEIALAPSEEQAFDGLTVGEAKKVLEKEDAIEYVRYVTHLPESFQRDFVKELVQGYNQVMVSSSTVDPLQAVKLASSLENGQQENYLIQLLRIPQICQDPRFFDIVKAFLQAKEKRSLELTRMVAQKKKVLNREDAVDLIRMFALAKDTGPAREAYEALKINRVMEREDLKEILKPIIEAPVKTKAEDIKEAAINSIICDRKDVLLIENMVAESKEDFQNYFAALMTRSKAIMKREDAPLWIKAVRDAQEEYQAKAGYQAATGGIITATSFTEGLSYLQAIVAAKGEDQADEARKFANETTYKKGSEYTRIIATAKDGQQAFYARTFLESSNALVLDEEERKKYMQTISKTEENFQSLYTMQSLTETPLLGRSDAQEIVEYLSTIEDEKKAAYAFNLIYGCVLPLENAVEFIEKTTALKERLERRVRKEQEQRDFDFAVSEVMDDYQGIYPNDQLDKLDEMINYLGTVKEPEKVLVKAMQQKQETKENKS